MDIARAVIHLDRLRERERERLKYRHRYGYRYYINVESKFFDGVN
tara:strand:- start:160 stop:294 length:135 start_codon:yes stop_codon:yes gene_type:complete